MGEARAEKGLHQLVRSVGLSQGAQPLLTFGISVLIARTLGPEGRGAYGVVMATVSVLPPLLGLGLTFAVRYWAARGRCDRLALVRTATALATVIGALCASVVVASWLLGRPAWLVPGDLGPVGASVFAGVLFSAVLTGFWMNYLGGLERYGYATWGVNVATALQLAALVCLWWLTEMSLDAALIALGLQSFFMLMLFPALVRHDLVGVLRASLLPVSELRGMLRYGRWQYLSGLLTQTNMRLNIFILAALAGEHETGLYAAALGPANFLQLAASPLSLVVVARAARREDDPNFPARVAGALRLMVVIMTGGALAGAALAPSALPWLFGARFEGSVVPFWILLPGVIGQAVVLAVAGYLQGAGRPEWNPRISGTGAVFTVGANLLLVPRYGASGAAAAHAIAFGVTAIVALVAFLRVSGTSASVLLTFRRSDWQPIRQILGLPGHSAKPRG